VAEDEIVESVIEDILAKLDPHSAYINAENSEYMNAQLQGNFDGIGIEFNIFHDTINVVSPLSGGPSEKLGIKSGDKIIRVNDDIVAGVGMKNSDVVKRLRGPKGSNVAVYIQRYGQKNLLKFDIERDVIPQYSVDAHYMVDNEIGYIKISRFSATTFKEFKAALKSLIQLNMSKLILDLTGNPGGYMDRAISIVDEFLDENKMIVYTKGKQDRFNNSHRSTRKGTFKNGSLIILIDEGSASASEIVAGALQDHDRALIVGRRSFGKGLVQMPIDLGDGSQLRLTISRYYTPSGRCIQKPYENNLTEYRKEYYERFTRGEMFVKDSIQIIDSLIYKTKGGRTVYGGGGVIPDYFVAYDTTQNSTYLNALFTSNTLAEYALSYATKNEIYFKKLGLKTFISDYQISTQQLREIKIRANRNGLVFDEMQFELSKKRLQRLMKAYIGRRIWQSDGFYPVYNDGDEIFLKAKTLFDEAERLISY
jgi:carboxyl-terminal processing protease